MSATVPAPTLQVDPERARRQWRVLLAVGLGCFVLAFDVGTTAVIAPVAADDLEMPFAAFVWVLGALALAFTSPYLALRRGAVRGAGRAVVLGGVTTMALGSALAGTAQLAAWFLLGRVLVALGAAAFVAGAVSVVRSTFDHEQMASTRWSLASAALCGLVSGPVLGGVLSDEIAWRLAPLVLLPALAAVAWLVALAVPPGSVPPEDPAGPVDAAGASIAVLALAGACVAVVGVPTSGLTAPVVLAGALVAIAGAAWLVRRVPPHGSLDRGADLASTPSARSVSSPEVVVAAAGWSLLPCALLVPLFLEFVLGVSASTTGVTMVAFAFGLAGGAGAAGLLGSSAANRRAFVVAAGGLVALAGSAAVIGAAGASAPVVSIAAALALGGVGHGLSARLSVGSVGHTTGARPDDRAPSRRAATDRLVSARAVGATIGLAVTAAVFKAVEQRRITDLVEASPSGGASPDDVGLAALLPAAPHSLAAIKRIVPEVAGEVNEVARSAVVSGTRAAMVVVVIASLSGAVIALRVGTRR